MDEVYQCLIQIQPKCASEEWTATVNINWKKSENKPLVCTPYYVDPVTIRQPPFGIDISIYYYYLFYRITKCNESWCSKYFSF